MGEHGVFQRPPRVMSGVGLVVALALAVSAWLPADDDVTDVASGNANAKPRLSPAGSSGSGDWRTPPTPTTAPPVPLPALASATTVFAVPITAAAPQKLQVGEVNDLIVGVGRNGGVGEISFTLQFDPNVLQVRAGTEGDWAAGAGVDARSFAIELTEEGDRAQIRGTVSDQRAGMAGGSVAIVQFQAVAPETTWVLITDVVVKDLAGKSIAYSVSAPNLRVTVDLAPPPQPQWPPLRASPMEPPTEATVEGD